MTAEPDRDARLVQLRHLDARGAAQTAEPFELLEASGRDRYFDYCLEPYPPRRPWRGKLRSENLLWHSLHVGDGWDALSEPLVALQSHVGTDLTVWGVKWNGTALDWELYLYDPRKKSAEATYTSVSSVLSEWFSFAPVIRESVPYMMVSFNLSPTATTVDDINLYLTGEAGHAGRSYKVHADRTELENTYRFLPPKREVDALVSLVKSSFFVDYTDPRALSSVLFPQLFACKKICVSKKRHCDAVYFSGIAIDQLRWFLERFDYPLPLRRFVARHESRLEHLFFDVGVDYRQRPDGTFEYPKTSYYGTL